jgi:hypothetical protein
MYHYAVGNIFIHFVPTFTKIGDLVAAILISVSESESVMSLDNDQMLHDVLYN